MSEISRAAHRIRNHLKAHAEMSHVTPEVFEALDLIEAAALMPRSIDEAEARMLQAEAEAENVYSALRDWTDWADKLVPAPPPLTRWGAHALRERIEAELTQLRKGTA